MGASFDLISLSLQLLHRIPKSREERIFEKGDGVTAGNGAR